MHGAVRLPQPAQARGRGRAALLRRRRQDRLPQRLGDRRDRGPTRREAAPVDRRRCSTTRDDADELAGADLVPALRALPRVRRRGDGGRRAPGAADRARVVPARRRSGWPARPVIERPGGRGRVRGRCAAACASSRRADERRGRSTRRSVRVRRRRRPLRRRAARAVRGRRLRPRDRRRHDDGRRSSWSTSTTGRVVATVVALENPQRFGGSDVMNRISYDEADERGELRHGRCAGRSTASSPSSTSARASTAARSTRSSSSATRRCATSSSASTSSPIGQRPYKSMTELELLEGARHDDGARPCGRTSSACGCTRRARVWGAPLIASHVGADVAADLVAIGVDGDADGVLDARRRRHEHRGRAARGTGGSSPRAARPARRSRAAR